VLINVDLVQIVGGDVKGRLVGVLAETVVGIGGRGSVNLGVIARGPSISVIIRVVGHLIIPLGGVVGASLGNNEVSHNSFGRVRLVAVIEIAV
jgi:hypothetical protein